MDMPFDKEYIQTGNAPKLKSVYAISLYDPTDGRICHMHRILNTEGSSPLDPQQMEQNAITNAEKFGHNVKKLKVLHTPDMQNISGNYRVDLEKKILVKISDPPIRFKINK